MVRSDRIVALTFSAATLLGLAACKDSSGVANGTVSVRLTNASAASGVTAQLIPNGMESPLPADFVKRVDIFIVRIDARPKEPTDAEASQAIEPSESTREGWVTVAEPNATFDLMQLANGANTLLGDAQVAVGSYSGFRLIIDPAKSSVTLNDDANTVISGESIVGLKFPSADETGIKIKMLGGGLSVTDGETSTLVVNFDVADSFVIRAGSVMQNGLLFKPVVRGEKP